MWSKGLGGRNRMLRRKVCAWGLAFEGGCRGPGARGFWGWLCNQVGALESGSRELRGRFW